MNAQRVFLLFAFAMLVLPFTVASDVDPDTPSTWDANYVTTNIVEAFHRDPQRAVDLVPTILAQTDIAEEFFFSNPSQILNQAYSSFAVRYLTNSRVSTGSTYQEIANYYLRSLSSQQFSGEGNQQNRDIANRYFSSDPNTVNTNRQLFSDFMAGSGVPITLDGNVGSYAADGVLHGLSDAWTLNVGLNSPYSYYVNAQGALIIIPREGDDMPNAQRADAMGHSVTGIITTDSTNLDMLAIINGKIDGLPVASATGVRFVGGESKLVYLTAAQFGQLTFKQATPLRYDALAKSYALDGAVITAVSGTDPVIITGDNIDVSQLANVKFVVPAGQQAKFLIADTNGRSGRASPLTVRALTTAAPVLINPSAGDAVGGVTVRPTGVTAKGEGFTVYAPAAAFDAAKYLEPPPGAFRQGMINLLPEQTAQVKVIQQFLQSQGLYHCGTRCAVDGQYGPMTADAVAQWQEQNGIVADGMWGPQTRDAVLAQFEIQLQPKDGATTLNFDSVNARATVEGAADLIVRGREGATRVAVTPQRTSVAAGNTPARTPPLSTITRTPSGGRAAMLTGGGLIITNDRTGERTDTSILDDGMLAALESSCHISRGQQCGMVSRLTMDNLHPVQIDGQSPSEFLGYPQSDADASRLRRRLQRSGWTVVQADAPLQSYDVLLAGPGRDRHVVTVIGRDREGVLWTQQQWTTRDSHGRKITETKQLPYDDAVSFLRDNGYQIRERLRAPPGKLDRLFETIADEDLPTREIARLGQ